MAIDGRINVDVLFHDTDGTASLKVVSLEDSTAYTTGKVAVVSGTVGTSGVTISTVPVSPAYRDATGAVVSFANVSRIAFQASRDCTASDDDDAFSRVRSRGSVVLTDWGGVGANIVLEPVFTSGTASYTLVLYGT